MAICTATKTPAVAGTLRRASDECVFEGIANVDVLDAATGAGVEAVEDTADGEEVMSGRDVAANDLTIIVPRDVKFAGVIVIWSARTAATLGAIE